MSWRSITQAFETGLHSVGWLSLPEPIVAEIMLGAGFQALVVDMQHGNMDLGEARAIIGSISRCGGHSLLRIPVGDFASASRLLDLGADAVIAPMIETAAEAADFARFMKYPPLGLRSWGPSRAVQLTGRDAASYKASANVDTQAWVMIETAAALANIDAILAVPGIDGVFVGPSDLSVALSPDAALDIDRADNLAAIAHIAERTNAAGKLSGIYSVDADHARRYKAVGYSFASLSADAPLLAGACKAIIADAQVK